MTKVRIREWPTEPMPIVELESLRPTWCGLVLSDGSTIRGPELTARQYGMHDSVHFHICGDGSSAIIGLVICANGGLVIDRVTVAGQELGESWRTCRVEIWKESEDVGDGWTGRVVLGVPSIRRVSFKEMKATRVMARDDEPKHVLLDLGDGVGWRQGPALIRSGPGRLRTEPWVMKQAVIVQQVMIVNARGEQLSERYEVDVAVAEGGELRLSWVGVAGVEWRLQDDV